MPSIRRPNTSASRQPLEFVTRCNSQGIASSSENATQRRAAHILPNSSFFVKVAGYLARGSITFILGLAVALLFSPAGAMAQEPDDPRARASFYIDTYGAVDSGKSPLARRAYEIFERVHQVAEDPIGVTPALKVIDSDGRPWAIALPDGHIILSRAALEICYQDVDQDTGDARLAFVLGHELSHLTANDFWHRRIYLSLSGMQNSSSLEQISGLIRSSAGVSADGDWRKTVRNKELRADEVGFTYASLAGFRTDSIFSGKHGGKDFLDHWVTQTRSMGGELHFSPKERSEFLRNRFRAIISKVEYFMSGVRLAHFGRYEDAAYFFEEFRNAFPAHEVLNNLGYINLQLARKHMPASIRYRFWMPLLMDDVPSIAGRNRSLGDTLPPHARRYLQRAVGYLEKAVNAHSTHVTSRLNLTTAYIYGGDYHKARAVIEEARALAPDSKRVSELRALVLYGQEKEIDMWPVATRLLKEIAPPNPSTLYNLARLHEERGRHDAARRYWKQLLSQDLPLPQGYLRIACEEIPDPAICDATAPHPASTLPPLALDLKTGMDIGSPRVKKGLQHWQRQRREIGPLPVDLFIAANGNSWLAIDSRLTIAVSMEQPSRSPQQLIQCCGKPFAIEPLGDSELWSWGSWSALIVNDMVQEIWIADTGDTEAGKRAAR